MHTTEGTQSKRRNGGARWEHAGMGCALHSPREVRYARTAPMAGIWRGMAAGKRGGAAALAARAVVRGHGPTIPRTSDGRRGPTEPSAMIATSVLNRSTVSIGLRENRDLEGTHRFYRSRAPNLGEKRRFTM